MVICPSCSFLNKKTTLDDEVLYCDNCKHYVYNKKYPREKLFGHENVGDNQVETRSKQFDKIFSFITRKSKSPEFVEIGAGFGGYINFANQLGYSCTAVDIDEHFKNRYLEAGIDFIQHDADNFSIKISQNVVIMSHIIEHLYLPKNVLSNILNENIEYLIVEVPISNGNIFKLSKLLLRFKITFVWNRLWQKNSNSPHLHYFSDYSIMKLFKNHNLKIEKTFRSRFSTLKGSFKRTKATESFLISFLSVIVIQFLEFLNYALRTSENKVYIVKNHNYKKDTNKDI